MLTSATNKCMCSPMKSGNLDLSSVSIHRTKAVSIKRSVMTER